MSEKAKGYRAPSFQLKHRANPSADPVTEPLQTKDLDETIGLCAYHLRAGEGFEVTTRNDESGAPDGFRIERSGDDLRMGAIGEYTADPYRGATAIPESIPRNITERALKRGWKIGVAPYRADTKENRAAFRKTHAYDFLRFFLLDCLRWAEERTYRRAQTPLDEEIRTLEQRIEDDRNALQRAEERARACGQQHRERRERLSAADPAGLDVRTEDYRPSKAELRRTWAATHGGEPPPETYDDDDEW